MPSDDNTPLAVERQRIILSILEREGVVRNTELKELLGVSLVTIRSDLRELAAAGECEIIWGGAVSKHPTPDRELLMDQRSKLNPEAKSRIGQCAATYVEEGQTIIVDAGTTTVELVHNLSHEMDYLRIVTPALNVAWAASHFPKVETVITGGVLRQLTRSLIGASAVRMLDFINADWVFLASGGFSIERGVTTGNILEVEVKRTMAQRAQKVALLADSTKFNKILSLTVMPLDQLDLLVTDTNMAESDADAICALGVDVVRV